MHLWIAVLSTGVIQVIQNVTVWRTLSWAPNKRFFKISLKRAAREPLVPRVVSSQSSSQKCKVSYKTQRFYPLCCFTRIRSYENDYKNYFRGDIVQTCEKVCWVRTLTDAMWLILIWTEHFGRVGRKCSTFWSRRAFRWRVMGEQASAICTVKCIEWLSLWGTSCTPT